MLNLRKCYYSILLVVFYSICGFAQHNNHIVMPESLQLPTKVEISRQANEWLERGPKRARNLDFAPTSTMEINDSIVKTLTPIVFVRIYPDTLDNNILKTEVMEDVISLWYTGGYRFSWTYKPGTSQFGFNLNSTGVSGRTDKIKHEINNLLPREYLLSFFPTKTLRWHFNYIGYSENGLLLIKDAQGNSFDTLEDLIISRYGSIEDYVMLYKYEEPKKAGL